MLPSSHLKQVENSGDRVEGLGLKIERLEFKAFMA